MLSCYSCGREHDFDNSPDTGECFWCGKELVENGEKPIEIGETFLKELSKGEG